ncbi:sensor histidine kinase [Haliangium ochraceum]|uniref:histidine kinase n=1 Tax=Haliangium ochraceum (strain DSM 14365 / JCM 11303 / SMP-2) TaxID=502025 RepID=D0LUG1_HALO1|nr:HAMP domain-containing sensor histidine kinase [Haliangium ochraceum]ACY19284.1 integral membrane sensor signal transduction histidine kinase [Haliangium ochraceum DSM 14365]
MRIPLLRSLSGRILLGFLILTLTFATISASIVLNMVLLGGQIRLIRTGYLPLALETKNLDEKQDILWSYLSDELPGETAPARAERRLVRHTRERAKSLRDTEKVLDELGELSTGLERRITETRRQVARIGDTASALEDDYRLLQTVPPLDSMAVMRDRSPAETAEYERSRDTLEAVIARESELRAQIKFLARQQSDQAKQIALTVERNEQNLRMFALLLGIAAVLIGLAVTAWATLTLRPLKRLRMGARHIARGEYQRRIDENGPTEVADLAREFNVMGHAIEERERELVRSERLIAVGKMSAVITHEVRNPLSSIGLNTELLTELVDEGFAEREDELAEEARSLCAAITTEVDRLAAITEEYLQFARLPKPKLQVERVDQIARSLVDFEREQLALRGAELCAELAAEDAAARVDDGQMRQALLNLVRNAADAVEAVGGGRVTVATRSTRDDEGEWVEIRVSDTGAGIAPEVEPKLYEPFFSTKQGGTGLGLALTHQIIREHGGHLRVEAGPERGATFVIALPAIAPEQDLV